MKHLNFQSVVYTDQEGEHDPDIRHQTTVNGTKVEAPHTVCLIADPLGGLFQSGQLVFLLPICRGGEAAREQALNGLLDPFALLISTVGLSQRGSNK